MRLLGGRRRVGEQPGELRLTVEDAAEPEQLVLDAVERAVLLRHAEGAARASVSSASSRSPERDQRDVTRSDTRSSAGRPTLPENSRSARPLRAAPRRRRVGERRAAARCSRSSRLEHGEQVVGQRAELGGPGGVDVVVEPGRGRGRATRGWRTAVRTPSARPLPRPPPGCPAATAGCRSRKGSCRRRRCGRSSSDELLADGALGQLHRGAAQLGAQPAHDLVALGRELVAAPLEHPLDLGLGLRDELLAEAGGVGARVVADAGGLGLGLLHGVVEAPLGVLELPGGLLGLLDLPLHLVLALAAPWCSTSGST